MPKLDKILNSSGNAFFKIMINWTRIAGKSNREIMRPVRVSKGILFIAVPNSMVLKTVKRFQAAILMNIYETVKSSNVKEIKFFSDPSKFKESAIKAKPQKAEPVILDENEVKKRNEELLKMGIDGSLSETMAQIDFILKKKNRR